MRKRPIIPDDQLPEVNPRDPLNEREAMFVELVCQGMKHRQAAIKAGYTEASAGQRGWKLMQLDRIKTAIARYGAKIHEALDASAEYTAETASKEIDEAMNLAQKTGNANALVNAVKLRCQLRGLLDKDKGTDAAGFSINILGLSSPEPTPKPKVINPPASGSIFD